MEFTLHNLSSTEGMKEIGNNTINLIITSPPYWDLKDYKNNNQLGLGMTYEFYMDLLKKNLYECVRVLKNDSFCVINVADIRRRLSKSEECRPKIFSLHCDIIKYFESMGLELFTHYIWNHKINHVANKVYGAKSKIGDDLYVYPPYIYSELSIEHILVFRKGGPIRKLPKPLHRRVDKFKLKEIASWLQPIWTINSTKSSLHPATFPEELVERLIYLFSITGDTILDPFCGTGTTLKVAKKLKRSCIGYELNYSYIEPLIKDWKMSKNNNSYTLKI